MGADESQLDLDAKHQAKTKPGASGKAKLSARQEAYAKCNLPRKSLNTYTWQEIQRHNQKTDQWLVINRKVYDVIAEQTGILVGGRSSSTTAGEDATVRAQSLALSLSVPAAGWLQDMAVFQNHFKYVFKLHDPHLLPKPTFQYSYPSKNLKAN